MTDEFETLFDQMIAQQRAKVLAVARTINPCLTEDDILSPQDFPELIDDPRFNYEQPSHNLKRPPLRPKARSQRTQRPSTPPAITSYPRSA